MLATLPADSLILDGEVVVADSRGIPDFALLHADLAAGRKDRLLRRTGRRRNVKMATRRPSIRLPYAARSIGGGV
jgi:ATP-dependent DNA ligase